MYNGATYRLPLYFVLSGGKFVNRSQETSTESGQRRLTLGQLTDLLADISDHEGDHELQLVELEANQVLFEQSDEGDDVYVLVAGMLGVRIRHEDGSETEIDRLAPGAIVGEMAFLSGRKRSATVYAINECGLIRLTKRTFEQLTPEERREFLDLDTTVVGRWQRLQLARVLRNLFGELDVGSLHALQDQLAWQHFSNGDVLFRQGDPADGMYIVVNGRLRITAITPEGEERFIGEVNPGEPVGEFALLTDEPRSATLHAVRESNVVKMTTPVFERLVRAYPELMGKIARIIVERRQRALRQSKPAPPPGLVLALLPASPNVDVFQFAQELAEALAQSGPALGLDSGQFDRRYGKAGASQTNADDPENPAIVSWMDELESNHKYLLFAADYDLTAWTRRCIGQADRVLILADPREDPVPGAAEVVLAQMEVPIRTELILWHPADTKRPQGTGAWLDTRRVHAHHHVRRDDEGHMDRLSRRLGGHAVSLVLSSGGARGYAHAGVYRALLELNIPLDMVGGTSIGALLAGILALEPDYDQVLNVANELGSSSKIFDYTLPLTALATSEKVTRLVQSIFGDLFVEDLWVPFFCVSTNLSRAEPVIHRRGLLWRAVRASLAIPGVFAPVIEDGEVLVDGGVMDSFPAETMAQLSESDSIIGVDVKRHKYKKRQYDMDTSISGWRILFHRLNPFTRPLRSPSLIGTVMRSTEIVGIQRAKAVEDLVDLMLYPDVKQFGPMAYDAYESIAQAGYDAALEPLREWWSKRQGD